MQIFWRLWPFKFGKVAAEDPDAFLGAKELIAIFLVSVLRTWHQDRIVYIKRDLLLATYVSPCNGQQFLLLAPSLPLSS